MGASCRQLVLASAAIAAAMLVGGASARAGYVSVGALVEHGGIDALTNPSALLWAKCDAPAAAGKTANPQPDAGDPPAPVPPWSPLRKLSPAACNFGESGAGSPSTAATGSGPSCPPIGDLPRPQVPPLQPIGLLPPHTGDAHTFSVVSFLFRPPRAA